MCVYIYIYACIYVYILMYVCMCVCVYVCMHVGMYVCVCVSVSVSVPVSVSLCLYIGNNRLACALGAGGASWLSCVRNMQRDMHAAGHARTDSRRSPRRLRIEQACPFVSDPSEQRRLTKRRTVVECISFGVGLLD